MTKEQEVHAYLAEQVAAGRKPSGRGGVSIVEIMKECKVSRPTAIKHRNTYRDGANVEDNQDAADDQDAGTFDSFTDDPEAPKPAQKPVPADKPKPQPKPSKTTDRVIELRFW